MKFAVAHKLTTYLMVGCAYLAMIAGGTIASPIAFAGLVAFVASWWWEPPRIRLERWTWVWTVGSVLALVYCALTAIATGDYLGVGAEFLIWLTIAKAFNRRAARDWQQMYLLAFLMLVAGSVLNADLSYGLCFLGFVISSTWALTLFHLRREMEDNLLIKHAADRSSERVEVRRILDSKRIVGRRFFVGTGVLSFGVFLAAAIVFLALPRVGFGFFLKSRSGLLLTGFNENVTLGGHGLLKSDPTVVMRVEIDSRYGGRDAPQIHWRGIAFDSYEGGRWSRTGRAPKTNESVERPSSGVDRHEIAWRDRPLGDPDNTAVKQEVWLDPIDSDVLFGASLPHVFELASVVRRSTKDLRNDELRLDHSGTIHYTVWSQLAPPSAAALRSANGPLPAGYEVYLQLPSAGRHPITQRTRDLARTITTPFANNYDKAVAIERWLDQNLSYSLELEEPRTEPVDDFLFRRKQGHCEYFASAFAVLARAAGIPTREVDGFLGGEWNEYQGYVAVRAGDAHAWDEVYFPGRGWVTFDPTPPGNDTLDRGSDGWRARLGRFLDTLRFQWAKWVIEYDLVAQLSLFKDIGNALSRAASAARDAVVHHWPVGLAVVALIALFVVVRRRRRGDPRAPAQAKARPRTRGAIAQLFDRVAKQLAKAGVAREPATTPRELADRLRARGHATAGQVGELVEIYYAAEWGGQRDPEAERRASALAEGIREKLINRRQATGNAVGHRVK